MNNRISCRSFKLFVLSIFTYCFTVPALYAQGSGIEIGDIVPDADLPEIIKFKNKSAALSDFKGKAILIDFWFTRCVSCIAKFPFLDSISKEYENDLQILQVTRDSKEEVLRFFENSKRWEYIRFPCVVNDTVLNNLFPHRSEPHYVWINKDGIVKAITDDKEVTREKMELFISGKKFHAVQKIENRDNNTFWGIDPLMLNYQKDKSQLLAYSYFSKHIEGQRAGLMNVRPTFDDVEKQFRIYHMGTSFNQLYGVAYGLIGSRNFHPSKIVREDTKQEKYIPDFNLSSNVYDYDLIVKDTSITKIFRYMQSDLDKFFDVKSSLEKRLIEVIVLKTINHSDKYQSKINGSNGEQYFEGKTYIVRDIPMAALINRLNHLADPLLLFPVIDESGYTGKVSMEVILDKGNFSETQLAFQKYGLMLKVEKRELDVIVIRD